MGHFGSTGAAQEKFRISRHTEPWQRAGRLSSAAFDPTFFLAENMESILLLWDRIAEVNCEVITVYPLVWGSSWFTCWFVHPKLGRQRWPIWIANPLWHIWHVSFLGQAGISPFWGKVNPPRLRFINGIKCSPNQSAQALWWRRSTCRHSEGWQSTLVYKHY